MRMPTRLAVVAVLAAAACLASLSASGPQAPQSAPAAKDIVARSVAAHGGDRLTSWKTLTIKGTVAMQDGITYNGAYTLFAKAPDRVRVEHDATADRGRAFYEYYLNGGVAWTRRNLIPAAFDAARIQRWLDQCYGIAAYARLGVTLELKGEAEMPWPPAPPDGNAAAPAPRRVWIVVATVGTETRELAIDKETSRFLREVAGDTTRVYWDFAPFDGALMPTRILEIAKTPRRHEDAVHLEVRRARRANRGLAVHGGHASEAGALTPATSRIRPASASPEVSDTTQTTVSADPQRTRTASTTDARTTSSNVPS
jgi:hypothetical protein